MRAARCVYLGCCAVWFIYGRVYKYMEKERGEKRCMYMADGWVGEFLEFDSYLG